MKKIITNVATVVFAVFFFFLLVSYDRNNKTQESGSVPIGTVIYSVIPPDVFLNTIEGESWRRLDGTAMDPAWELSEKINENSILKNLNGKLPDASGMFLRAMNYESTGADPKKNRLVGEKQWDAFEKHTHPVEFVGKTDASEHLHNINLTYTINKLIYRNATAVNADKRGLNSPGNDITYSEITGVENPYTNVSTNKIEHSHVFKYTGNTGIGKIEVGEMNSTETRPVNVAFYVYIKVNN